jgi:2-oxoglutarate dehydrogenase E2 component (dihydrolipoamide succinyltransferase)
VIAPAARRLIKELKLDPSRIPASGKDGRILKSDVMAYLDEREKERPRDDLRAFRSEAEPSEQPAMSEPGERPEQRVPMTRLRARVAERLVQAQHTAAILTTFNEVDMQPVMDMRNRYRERFERQHEIRLGFMSFFVKAAVEALKRFPVVNAAVDDTTIVYHGYYDIGIAVSSPRGLVVPILRDCDQLSFADIEKGIAAFGGKAKDGSLSYEELTGGTFSITNGGIFGSLLSTPILNPPQSAILGMHAIKERPMVVNGQICVRPMMYLALSYDHRIIDGRDAVQFLVTIKECLEDPARLLLQV